MAGAGTPTDRSRPAPIDGRSRYVYIYGTIISKEKRLIYTPYGQYGFFYIVRIAGFARRNKNEIRPIGGMPQSLRFCYIGEAVYCTVPSFCFIRPWTHGGFFYIAVYGSSPCLKKIHCYTPVREYGHFSIYGGGWTSMPVLYHHYSAI